MDEGLQEVLARLAKLSPQCERWQQDLKKAHATADIDAEAAVLKVRKVLNYMVICLHDRIYAPKEAGSTPLENLIQLLAKDKHLPRRLLGYTDLIRNLGNTAAHHPEDITREDFEQACAALRQTLLWFSLAEFPDNQTGAVVGEQPKPAVEAPPNPPRDRSRPVAVVEERPKPVVEGPRQQAGEVVVSDPRTHPNRATVEDDFAILRRLLARMRMLLYEYAAFLRSGAEGVYREVIQDAEKAIKNGDTETARRIAPYLFRRLFDDQDTAAVLFRAERSVARDHAHFGGLVRVWAARLRVEFRTGGADTRRTLAGVLRSVLAEYKPNPANVHEVMPSRYLLDGEMGWAILRTAIPVPPYEGWDVWTPPVLDFLQDYVNVDSIWRKPETPFISRDLLVRLTPASLACHAYICYQRPDAEDAAMLLHVALRGHGIRTFVPLGPSDVTARGDESLREIREAPFFILVLSPRCLDGARGKADGFRREIAHAIASNRVIVPVLREGFALPPRQLLHPDIAGLPAGGVRWSNDQFDDCVAELLRRLREGEVNQFGRSKSGAGAGILA